MATYVERNGTYTIQVSDGFDSRGNRVRKSMTWKPDPGMSQKAINRELAKRMAMFEDAVRAGEVGDQNITLAQFSEIWLRDYGAMQLKDSTFQNYKKLLERRILPALGAMKLCKIRPQNIIAFYNDLRDPEAKEKSYYQADAKLKKYLKEHKITMEKLSKTTGLGYSTVRNMMSGKHVYGSTMETVAKALEINPKQYFTKIDSDTTLTGSTILYLHHILRTMFTCAVQWQIVTSNPCERVKPPKQSHKRAAYLEEEDLGRLFACLESVDIVYRTLITLYVSTGMRRGEALGLTWKDVNFEKSLIDINKSMVYVHNDGVKIDTPKNETSKRVIKVSPSTMLLLREWKQTQEGYRQTYGDLYQDTGYVFTNKLGKPFHPDSISSWFGRFVRGNDLPPIHLHSLRHTNASLMIANGVDVETVSKRLGHADAQTTITIYTHQIRTADAAAAEMLDEFVSGRRK